MRRVILFALILALEGIAYAASQSDARSLSFPETRIELSAGDGLDKVQAFCNICHSLDYITMQPRFSRAQWAGIVNKMIKVYGAPINEEDEKKIISYLAEHYGIGN